MYVGQFVVIPYAVECGVVANLRPNENGQGSDLGGNNFLWLSQGL